MHTKIIFCVLLACQNALRAPLLLFSCRPLSTTSGRTFHFMNISEMRFTNVSPSPPPFPFPFPLPAPPDLPDLIMSLKSLIFQLQIKNFKFQQQQQQKYLPPREYVTIPTPQKKRDRSCYLLLAVVLQNIRKK